MVAIFSQDKTWILSNADDAKATLLQIYGNKLGMEAFNRIQHAPEGTSYRQSGGPLVQVVSKEKAAWIKEKESALGMM